MPYSKITELPASVKEALPVGAQRIFMAAFNSASRDGKSETSAFKIAWSAVKVKYRRTGDKWVKKQLSTPAYIGGAIVSRENLSGPKKPKKPKK